LRFLLWVFLAVIFSFLHLAYDQELFIKFEFKRLIDNKKFVISMSLLLMLVFTVLLYEIRFWAADVVYTRALTADNSAEREDGLAQALRLNKNRSNYYVALSKHYHNISRETMKRNSENYDMNLVNENINKSINVAKDGLAMNPSSVALYEALGMVYRTMNSISGNTGPLAKQAFAKASELEPSNPVIKTELAKAMFASQEYENAISTYKDAIALKDDYYDAYFNLARAYIQTGKNAEALDLLQRFEKDINNPELYYERGRANYNLKNYKKAIEDFKIVISNTPLHSNALYSLGLALNETGEYAEALVYLNKALAINPNNGVLKKLIAEIEEKK
jgi:tetratricopeptide (TPR) repeat protein